MSYQGIYADPGTGPNKVPVASKAIEGKNAQVVILDVGDGSEAKPVGPDNALPVKAVVNDSAIAADLGQGFKTIADAGTPEAIADTASLVDSVMIQACKGYNVANASPVFVGIGGNNQNPVRLRPWETLTISAPAGKKLDLHQIFVDVVTNGDGVSFLSVN